jgi:hypothetical protein
MPYKEQKPVMTALHSRPWSTARQVQDAREQQFGQDLRDVEGPMPSSWEVYKDPGIQTACMEIMGVKNERSLGRDAPFSA